MKQKKNISIYLCYLLRHHPEEAELEMDRHGWVSTRQLIENVNAAGKYTLTLPQLQGIVEADEKGRYRFNVDGSRIKACQGHSIPWVEPELTECTPPELLYHGTTEAAWSKIQESGYISRCRRHAVHMQAEPEPAWLSARRWKRQQPVVLCISAGRMSMDGVRFGVSDNHVWCTERVDVKYVCDVLRM
ncbi:MAG: RNA 2'-phosphotransferase [Butyricicoccaceae bacterium]